MRLSKAIESFALYCGAIRQLRPRTIETYRDCLDRLGPFLEIEGIENIEDVDHTTIQGFFLWLETDYKPRGWNKKHVRRLSKGSIQKTWIALRSFYKWASSPSYGINLKNIMSGYPMPPAPKKQVEPFSVTEVTKILLSVKPPRSKTGHIGKNALVAMRNEVIIHVLLEVGLRSAELRGLRVGDYTHGRLYVREGKGGKDRYVYLGQKTNYLIHRYINARGEPGLDEWLFPTRKGKQITRDVLLTIVKRIGKRAGVSNCHPHRFRHTCAVMRVLNGQTAETLMHLLGHTTINMSMRYVNLAKVDTSKIQRGASPVDNL